MIVLLKMVVSMLCPKSRGCFLIGDVSSEAGAGVWALERELGYFLALGKLDVLNRWFAHLLRQNPVRIMR